MVHVQLTVNIICLHIILYSSYNETKTFITLG